MIYVLFFSKWYIKTQLLLFLQEYSIQITFRQQWNDHRLKFDSREGKINYYSVNPIQLL